MVLQVFLAMVVSSVMLVSWIVRMDKFLYTTVVEREGMSDTVGDTVEDGEIIYDIDGEK